MAKHRRHETFCETSWGLKQKWVCGWQEDGGYWRALQRAGELDEALYVFSLGPIVLVVEIKRVLGRRLRFENTVLPMTSSPTVSSSPCWTLANPFDGPTWGKPSCVPLLIFSLWQLYHPHSTFQINWHVQLVTEFQPVQFCFIPLHLHVWPKLRLQPSSPLSFHLVHHVGMWQTVRVQIVSWSLLLTGGSLLQEQSYSPPWAEEANPDRSAWQPIIGLLWVGFVHGLRMYLRCSLFTQMPHQRLSGPR